MSGRRQWLGLAASSAAYLFAARAMGEPSPASGAGPAAPLRLALNENPFGPSPLAVRAIQAHLTGLARYTGAEADELIRAIATRERVLPEQVVLGEVLEALGQYLGRQGSGEILYSDPGYTALVDAARPYGATGVPVPLDAQLGNDLPALRSRLGARTRAVFLVNPHNPSGTVGDAAALHAFVEEAARIAPVIVDEAYLEYVPDFAERTLARQVTLDGRVVVFRTFTKFYGLAALPLGYALLPRVLAEAVRKAGLGAARSQNRLAVVAARASLDDAGYAERVRRQVAVERQRWFDVLDGLHLQRTPAAGNFVFFRAGLPQARLAAAFATRGIDIGRSFPPLDDWTRISIGLPEENARAQQALRQILAAVTPSSSSSKEH